MWLFFPDSVNINYQSFDGKTALHIAASGGHFDSLKLLLERGADPNLVDSWFETALLPGELMWLSSVISTAIFSSEFDFGAVCRVILKAGLLWTLFRCVVLRRNAIVIYALSYNPVK